VTVPASRVFLLGDRRDIARDSRAHLAGGDATVPVSAIEGRVVAAIWPLGTAGVLAPARPLSANPLDPASVYLYAGASILVGVVLLASGAASMIRRRRRGSTPVR
jgi:signal peptidase I